MVDGVKTPIALNLAADGEGKPVPMGLEGYPTEADGTPIFYRRVKLAPCRKWTHRATGEQFDITRERADEWIKNTRALSAAGIKPFLPGQHREEFNGADNHGYLVDLTRDGDDLYGVLALYGDDARKAAAVNSRSIYVVRDAMDATGKVHAGESIAHVALVPNPALPDLGGTMSIAASAGESKPVKVFELAADAAGGHWVTIEGEHVFIRDSAGVVPSRVKADANDKGRVSKAAIQRRLLQHHHDTGGKGEYTAQDEKDLNAAAGAGDPFTFKGKLPTEIKEFMAGRPELRSMFRVTDEAGKAGGADAFGELGDRYLQIAEAKAGSPLKAAVATAHASQDPEIQFLAHVHDNLPAGGGKNLEPIKAGGLRVGDEFKVNGSKFRVAEDSDGFRVLRSHEYGAGDVPVDALDKIPVDKGSFQRAKGGRSKPSDAIPFSAGGLRSYSARVLSLDAAGGRFRSYSALALAADGHWITIDGTHVLIKDGKIAQGPGHMVGKKPSDFGHDGKADGTKAPSRDLFGRETFDKGTGNRQGGLFHEPTTHEPVKAERVGSKSASDPKNTGLLPIARDPPAMKSGRNDEGQQAAAALKHNQTATIDGERVTVMSVRTRNKTETVYHQTDPGSTYQGERTVKVTTVEARLNDARGITLTQRTYRFESAGATRTIAASAFRSHSAKTLNLNG